MKNVGWNILFLSLALIDSAEVAKRCPPPPEYPHTRLLVKYRGSARFLSGDKVYYDCAEDFTPARGSRAAQCVDGKWTQLTLKCEKKSCGNAGELPYGEFQYEGNSFLGEKVYAVCNDGFTVKGLNYMVCKKSGWTGEFPICEEGETTCSSPAVADVVSSAGDVSLFQPGDSVNVSCRDGFQLHGQQQLTCSPGGLWQPQLPQCLPVPTKPPSPAKETGRCGVPENIRNSNANLADKYITMTSFASGYKVYYTCDVGYIQAGGSRYRRCIKGKWTPLWLKCERKPCGSAGEILNGQFVYSGVEFGDKATAVCDEGYHLVGHDTRRCMSNGWDGRVPDCEAEVCEAPSKVMNAEMIGPQEPYYTYRAVLHYRCRVGTLVGQRQIWCTQDGTWSSPPPKCEEMTCPPPNVPHAYWSGAPNKLHQYRYVISIECNPGYTKTGPSTVTCGGNGRWSPGLPRCTPRRNKWRG